MSNNRTNKRASVIKQAIEAIQQNNNHRVRVWDGWYKTESTYHIDNIRLEAKSGMVTGFSGGERVFTMTAKEFSEFAESGLVVTHYNIDHCSIRKEYSRID